MRLKLSRENLLVKLANHYTTEVHRVLARYEMQTASTRYWTRVTESISWDDNHYTMSARYPPSISLYIYIYIYIVYQFTSYDSKEKQNSPHNFWRSHYTNHLLTISTMLSGAIFFLRKCHDSSLSFVNSFINEQNFFLFCAEETTKQAKFGILAANRSPNTTHLPPRIKKKVSK